MQTAAGIDVYSYADVRAFLRDVYQARKASRRPLSFRAFSRKVGLRSPNHLKRVIDGERTLTPPMAVRYAHALGLAGDKAAYFCDLAAFGRARSAAERNVIYERMSAYRGVRQARRLDLAHAAYHSKWWIPATRELAARSDFRADPAWIAGRLMPAVTHSDAAQALSILFELGLLTRHDDGAVSQGEQVLTTGPETRGLHIGNYHRSMMERAAAAIDEVHRDQRDISSLTFAIGPTGLARLKERIQRFRKEVIALATEEQDRADQVVQLNMQLFPLSTSASEES